MAGILDSVDQRTQLVGENRLELLLFKLQRGSLFALNVFKIQEVQTMPKLTSMPHSHPHIVGVTHARGRTIPVIDLGAAIGLGPLEDRTHCNIIISEYNRTVQAFLVKSVDRIVNMNWEEIMPPPKGAGRSHYLTAITKLDGKLVEVIDVEKVLQEVSPYNTRVNPELVDQELVNQAQGIEILAVDDSSVGLSQVKETVQQLGVKLICASDGAMALKMLKSWAEQGIDVSRKLAMVITDAEMPEMDGYRLTREIRDDPRLKDLHVILHTSLSGNFNKAMVEKVGCNGFLSKFEPDKLAITVQERIKDYLQQYSH
ncbi:chemotaxis protein CheV [Ketobacter sp.]|uniref:chemotaxis protein CheV n=1 Tax=Ketobacter sp. TaxID=2083498 RepID=UPI000F132C63|nr:chemotaxis protein CheV [Ketobacter sp.]RLT93496.1 MAG: chemotaxis signal transduction protein CheV [Ketobacter sp.]